MDEQNNTEPEPEYVRGFNEGYTIAQYNPELAEKLSNIDSDFIRLAGFKDGRKQYQIEQVRDRLPNWLKNDRFNKEQKTPDRSKDKDVESRE
jgi:hypothetical protein